MRSIVLLVLLFLSILAGCSSSTTEGEKKESRGDAALVAEQTANHAVVTDQAGQSVDKAREKTLQPPPADAPAGAARMKPAGVLARSAVYEAMPISPPPAA